MRGPARVEESQLPELLPWVRQERNTHCEYALELAAAARRNHFHLYRAECAIALCVSRIYASVYWFRISCATCSQMLRNLYIFRKVRETAGGFW